MNRALIISPIMEQRIKLQRLLDHMAAFSNVDSVHSLDEATGKFTATKKIQFVFINEQFDDSDTAEFISAAKGSRAYANSAFIMLNTSNEQHKDTIANHMIVGFHGFLFEPYSEDSIFEVVSLSGRVQEQESSARLKAATGLMLTDTIAEMNGNAEDPVHKDTWEKVKHSCEEYKKITGESLTLAVVGALEKMSPANRLPKYNGASKRVRSLLKEKMKLRLKRNAKDEVEEVLPPEPAQKDC